MKIQTLQRNTVMGERTKDGVRQRWIENNRHGDWTQHVQERIWETLKAIGQRKCEGIQTKLEEAYDYKNTSQLHSTLSLEPIHEFIYRLTTKFFHNCSTHPNHLVCQIGNYTLLDLHVQYRKYIHKRTKHLLL